MARSIDGTGIGCPDYVFPPRFRLQTIRSTGDEHFTEELSQDEVERENVSGLEIDKIVIQEISIHSREPIHFQLLFYQTDKFEESDMDDDAYIGMVDLDLETYGELI